MLKAKDLTAQRDEELEALLAASKQEIFDLRSRKHEAKTQKTHLIGEKRKEIARILTVKRERELQRQ